MYKSLEIEFARTFGINQEETWKNLFWFHFHMSSLLMFQADGT